MRSDSSRNRRRPRTQYQMVTSSQRYHLRLSWMSPDLPMTALPFLHDPILTLACLFRLLFSEWLTSTRPSERLREASTVSCGGKWISETSALSLDTRDLTIHYLPLAAAESLAPTVTLASSSQSSGTTSQHTASVLLAESCVSPFPQLEMSHTYDYPSPTTPTDALPIHHLSGEK